MIPQNKSVDFLCLDVFHDTLQKRFHWKMCFKKRILLSVIIFGKAEIRKL